MKRTVLLVAFIVPFISACSKQDTAPVSTTPPPAGTNQVTEAHLPPPPTQDTSTTTIPANAAGNVDLDRLTMQLRGYVYATGDKPRQFQDFVARAHLQVPPPPPGKRYAISPRMWVILEDAK